MCIIKGCGVFVIYYIVMDIISMRFFDGSDNLYIVEYFLFSMEEDIYWGIFSVRS